MNKEKLREEVLSIIRYAITEEYRSNPGPIDTDAADEIMQLIEKHMEEEDD